MKLEAYLFEHGPRVFSGQQISGKVMIPKGAKIVHVGAAPPNGQMMLYCEVPEVETQKVQLDFAIVQQGQSIPDDYVYRGYILAVPILFVYQKDGPSIITG